MRSQPLYVAATMLSTIGGLVVGWCTRRIYDVKRGSK